MSARCVVQKMNILLRSATIIDKGSPFHLQQKDILINEGIIKDIGNKLAVSSSVKIIEGKNCFVSCGWVDMYANLCDPGYEQKENISTVLRAAAAGGFTSVCAMPTTNPVTHNKAQIEYLKKKSEGNLVNLFPLGAVTQNCAGKELAELYDMHNAGAVAFSDGENTIQHADLMMRALQYALKNNSVIYSHADEKTISHGGQMNESGVSAMLGMKGIPSMAEHLILVRDLYLAEYTNSHVHFPCISTKHSVELIRGAKKKGVKVTCGVNPINLFLTENAVLEFDSNLKLNPPLRDEKEIVALEKGLHDGTIDVICSAHQPQNIELKDVEFEYAAFGMINLQTAFSLAVSAAELSAEEVAEKFSTNPSRILGIKNSSINKNEKANLTLFSLNEDFIFTKENNFSLSQNSALFGRKLKGKVKAVFNNNQYFENK